MHDIRNRETPELEVDQEVACSRRTEAIGATAHPPPADDLDGATTYSAGGRTRERSSWCSTMDVIPVSHCSNMFTNSR